MIRRVNPTQDIEALCEIYNHYVTDTVVTFETAMVDPETMRQRIEEITEQFPCFVYEQGGRVLGYCYASIWRARAAFVHTVETSVYVHKEWTGRGFGYELYQELLKTLREARLHVAVAGITLPNTKSVALHEKFGFQKVAHFTEVGNKFDKWLDVGFWELNF